MSDGFTKRNPNCKITYNGKVICEILNICFYSESLCQILHKHNKDTKMKNKIMNFRYERHLILFNERKQK